MRPTCACSSRARPRCRRPLFERISDVFGQPPLERYGTTESGLNVSNLYDGPRQPGGVGISRCRASRSPSTTRRARSPCGVRRSLPATRAGPPRAEAEWFPTGDLARTRPGHRRGHDHRTFQGHHHHRRHETSCPGRWRTCWPATRAVDAVAVVGAPSKRWGEEVTAFVVSAQRLHARRASPLGPAATERLQGSEALPSHRGHPPEPDREGHAERTRRTRCNPRRAAGGAQNRRGVRPNPCDRHVPRPLTSIGLTRGPSRSMVSVPCQPDAPAVEPKGKSMPSTLLRTTCSRRFHRLLATAITVVLVAAACGGGGGDDSSTRV